MKLFKTLFLLSFVAVFIINCSPSDAPDGPADNGINNNGDGNGDGGGNDGGNSGTDVTWMSIPVPPDPGSGMTWDFQEDVSDNFEYNAPAANKGNSFLEKWDDWYHNAWTGPPPTVWRRDHSFVENEELKLIASRQEGSTDTNAGAISSNSTIVYPVYIEARVKIMNSTLANGVWLLSPDDTQEIDIVEAYGSDRWNNAWFAPDRVHLSHHVFIRQPFQDWQPNDEGSFYKDGSTIWREDFHRYGVYWKDPWSLEYYIDGELVRTRYGVAEIDPLNYTNGEGLSKAMDILITVEDQTWRANDGLSPTFSELENRDNQTMRVDWIRVYKPVKN